jgi:pilus assembly protein Flp/PilA
MKMKALTKGIKRFLVEEEGVTMVEYGLLAALIAVVCIVAIRLIGTNLNAVFEFIAGELDTVPPAPAPAP